MLSRTGIEPTTQYQQQFGDFSTGEKQVDDPGHGDHSALGQEDEGFPKDAEEPEN